MYEKYVKYNDSLRLRKPRRLQDFFELPYQLSARQIAEIMVADNIPA